MDEGEIRRYSNDKKICMARVTCGCLIRVTDMKVAQADIESPRAGLDKKGFTALNMRKRANMTQEVMPMIVPKKKSF